MIRILIPLLVAWFSGKLRKRPCVSLGAAWDGPYPQWIKELPWCSSVEGKGFWKFVKAHLYAHDTLTYLAEVNGDHWQTPLESIELGTGDCEDYASLIIDAAYSYGVDAGKLYWLYLYNEKTGAGHILALFMDDERDPLVADNNLPHPVRLHAAMEDWPGYVPVSVFNRWEAREVESP